MTPHQIAQEARVSFWKQWHEYAGAYSKELPDIEALILSAAAKMVRESGAEQLVERVITGVPACDEHGQLYQMHFDKDGRELGPEYVDPLAVIQSMQGCAHAALQSLRALTEHSGKPQP